MPRIEELRLRLNETQKAVINVGLNDGARGSFKAGFYLINLNNLLTLEELTSDGAWDKFAAGANLKRIPAELVEAMNQVAEVGLEKIREANATMKQAKEAVENATTNAGKRITEFWNTEKDVKTKTAVTAAAKIGSSMLGLYADVGAKVNAQISVAKGPFEFEANAFLEAKAGVRYGWLGISAQVSAEAAIDAKAAVNLYKTTVDDGNTEITLQMYTSIKAFAKAEAFIGVGTKTGAEAFAGVGLEGKAGFDILKQKLKDPNKDKKAVTAGAASVALTLKAGAAIGASAGFTLEDDDEGFKSLKVGFNVALIGGIDGEINAKILSSLAGEADEIAAEMKERTISEVCAHIAKEASKIKDEIAFQIQDSARTLKRGWKNAQNYGAKLVIAIEEGLGLQTEAIHDEINRQIEKLHVYKAQLDEATSALGESNDPSEMERILAEVKDKGFLKRAKKWFGPTITNKQLKIKLAEGIERHDRRIVKLGEFLDGAYQKTNVKIKKDMKSLNSQIVGLDVSSMSDSDYDDMMSKINDVADMIKTIKEIIQAKMEVLNDVTNDNNLRSLISQMGKEVAQMDRDFSRFLQTLQGFTPDHLDV